ncbi:MAG: TonB-dependent receptor [Flavobacteriaceae bacterium]|nr:TonB-dependent receptor [Flavobacteriaceae bacterium]|tara:strand:- start:4983 stop:7481 length:2499 start_codon:yes stop_codon:yes gene_type:complete
MIFLKENRILIFIFLFFSLNIFSQKLIVKDAKENTSIPDVSIYNSERSITIISDIEGNVNYSGFQKSDTLIFSHIGYEKLKILVSKIPKSSSTTIIYLNPNPQILSEIILSVGRNKESSKKISKKVSVITPKKTELDLPQNSAELLYYGGGVRIQKSQGGGGSPVIRGFEANRVLLVIDGVRMNNAIYRSGHLQNAITIDPNSLERTEVIFGPSSVGYGSDALGGVVHFYTKTPKINNEKKWTIKGLESYNTTLNHTVSNLNFEYSNKKWASFSSFSYSDFGNIVMGENRTHGFKNWGLNKFNPSKELLNSNIVLNNDPNLQKNTDYSQFDLLQKFNFKVSENSNLIFNIQHSKSSNIDRYDKINEYSTQEDLKYAEWYYGPQKRTLFSATYNFLKEKTWLNKGTIVTAFQKINESRHNRKFKSLTLNSQTEDLDVFSINADFVKKNNGLSSLSYGFEYTYNNVNSIAYGSSLAKENISISNLNNFNSTFKIPTRYPSDGSNYSTAASYYEFRKDISDKSNFNLGMRYTYTWLNASWLEEALIDANLSTIKSQNSSLTGSLGYVYRSNTKWQISGNFSSGFRSPNIDDMGKIRENRGILSVPNQQLKPEYAYNSELSFTKFFNNTGDFFSLNFYYTHITDHITRDYFKILNDLTTEDPTTILYNSEEVKTMANINGGRAYVYGFSFDLEAVILKNLILKSNITFTKGGSVNSINPLPSISPLFGSFYLKWANSNFKNQLSYRFSGYKNPQDYSYGGEDGLEETPLLGYNGKEPNYYGMPSWGIFKLSSSYQISNKLTATLIFDNIFDIHYREFASGISSPGRNLNIVLAHKL